MPVTRSGKRFDRRPKYLQKKSTRCSVYRTREHGVFVVGSPSNAYYYVRVRPQGWFRCSCRWSRFQPHLDCSHVAAVRDALARNEGRYLALWKNAGDAKRQKKPAFLCSDGLWGTLGVLRRGDR